VNISHSGNLTIAGSVTSDGTGTGGYQTFTGGGSTIGHCQIGGNLVGTAARPYNITIQNYNQVTVGGYIENKWTSGNHVYYDQAGANIEIKNIGSGGIDVSGKMDTSRAATLTGNVGNIVLSASGPITTRGSLIGVEITGETHNDGPAGNLDFDSGTSITILGAIDLDNGASSSKEGYAVLTTTGGTGYTIVLGNVDNPGNVTLDFNKINYVQFESFTGESVIYQTISGFSGNGSTQFRVGTAGHKIYYYHDETVNTALRAGGTDGVYNIGGSGTLEPIPEPPKGTVIIVK
jgi:hypothetical protein